MPDSNAMGLPHCVPLRDTACELVKKAMQTAKYGYLFPGDKKGRSAIECGDAGVA
ncbi:hypothetical protein GXB81_19680 [Paraburkholderia sp. Ac-20336]|uniref:hypothetical protein n=1 Tax=Paraburkholderia sp. Ac-20336 TaxID=2703886 RepID=UPI00197FE31B|nr:hypothetical protein [Paraburkholderia sp. Ac-20336]MBN3805252.1 hypothetical protein [Paraburkholderia sp. Ac-20336]